MVDPSPAHGQTVAQPLHQWGAAPLGKGALLRQAAQFALMRSEGRTQAGRCLVVSVLPAPDGCHRAGMIASKRFSRRAVDRNRARRCMREAYRLLRPALNAPVWVVLIARAPLLRQGAAAAQRDLLAILRRHDLIATP